MRADAGRGGIKGCRTSTRRHCGCCVDRGAGVLTACANMRICAVLGRDGAKEMSGGRRWGERGESFASLLRRACAFGDRAWRGWGWLLRVRGVLADAVPGDSTYDHEQPSLDVVMGLRFGRSVVEGILFGVSPAWITAECASCGCFAQRNTDAATGASLLQAGVCCRRRSVV